MVVRNISLLIKNQIRNDRKFINTIYVNKYSFKSKRHIKNLIMIKDTTRNFIDKKLKRNSCSQGT